MDNTNNLQAVLDFLRTNGFHEAVLALNEDITLNKELLLINNKNNNHIGSSYDIEKLFFPMNPPLPPVKVPTTFCRRPDFVAGTGSGPDSSGDDEFKSLESSSSAAGVCSSSDFTNPYGCSSVTQTAGSDTSSDRLSQFGTAREYHDFEMQTDLWYDDKDDGPYMTPSFGGLDPFGFPSEDKFVMSSETRNLSRNPFSLNRLSEVSEETDRNSDYPFQSHGSSMDNLDNSQVKDCYHLDEKICGEVGVEWDLGRTGYSDGEDLDSNLKEAILNELEAKIAKQTLADTELVVKGATEKNSMAELDSSKSAYDAFKQELLIDNGFNYGYEVGDDKELVKSSFEPSTGVNIDEQEDTKPEEIPYWETNENEYEVFNLRIIHRKNRTGFEESKEFPIVLNTILVGRYYITEYLGSAAFSKVVQAHDIQTGVDVCLKIIKNNKDFFDQSLDEIKLLKYANKHDPADEHHILRLYDYFYHQEHLFIVCELLRANLYEFQKYNLESGGEPYFTMGRLQ